MLIWDVAVRLLDVQAFYTDQGILPRHLLFKPAGMFDSWSLHLANGSTAFQAALLIAQGAAGLSFLLGFRTRLSALVAYVLLASIQRRNSIVINGGDEYLRFLVFWSMFIPAGRALGIDSIRTGALTRRPVLTIGTMALLIQTALLYWTTAVLKARHAVWLNGEAVYYTLHIDPLVKDTARWLLAAPGLARCLTHATLWFEAAGPFLLFAPFSIPVVRTFAALGFFFMHVGFWSFMNVWPFPFVSAIAITTFLPPWFWNRLSAALRQRIKNPPVWMRNVRRNFAVARLGPPMNFRHNGLSQAFCAVCLLAVVWWNLDSVTAQRWSWRPARNLCMLLDLDQSWAMFIEPARRTGWWVIPGRLQDGRWVDLFQKGSPVKWIGSAPTARFGNERWLCFLSHLNLGHSPEVLPEFARFLCDDWNSSHPVKLTSIQFASLNKETPEVGGIPIYQKHVIGEFACRVKR